MIDRMRSIELMGGELDGKRVEVSRGSRSIVIPVPPTSFPQDLFEKGQLPPESGPKLRGVRYTRCSDGEFRPDDRYD